MELTERTLGEVRQSGAAAILRDDSRTVEQTLALVEQLLGLL